MIDRGSGIPIVLIPGIQGRWEWMAPTVDALAERCRVLSFSLCDEPTSGFRFDAGAGFESYVRQVLDALDRARVRRAVIVGVSFSGLIATEFARLHPNRVAALVLVSALPPGWTPDRRARFHLRAPRLLSPLFYLASPARMLPELRTAIPAGRRARFMLACGYRVVAAPLSPKRMAQRVRCAEHHRFGDLSEVHVPALVITGEDGLDRVVSPSLTRQYVEHLPDARHVALAGTGHIGLVTKPGEFANLVCRFAAEVSTDGDRISA